MDGLLFTTDFLKVGIQQTPGWLDSEAPFIQFRSAIERLFARRESFSGLNEAQTEDELIIPVLEALGWGRDFLRQQSANAVGREDVPDFLLFPSNQAKEAAMAIPARSKDRRFKHGIAIIEAKKYGRALDRGESTDVLDPGTPSSQMLRYLSRVEVASDRAIKWGMLTNGQLWRLYWQDARSRAEEFVQFNLEDLSGVAGVNSDLFGGRNQAENVHYLRAFFLLFRQQAFSRQAPDGKTFHLRALDEGRLWESQVSQDLGQRVFDEIFPQLTQALARADVPSRPLTETYLDEVHRAALIFLYRMLFVLYAEDRNLLPVHDERYDDYSLRWLRSDLAHRIDAGDTFSATATRAWQHLRSLFRAIDQGDDSLGLPPYNGGLFHQSPDSLLARVELPDMALVPILDGLSRRPDISGRAFINYRDLAVQHLGSIYERLLEQKLVEDHGGTIKVKPSPFARKSSGSYYTHDDLVKLILKEAITPLADERVSNFDAVLQQVSVELPEIGIENAARRVAAADPAEALLGLRICDPAMGSGHFLVSLVDDMADRVLEQLADAPAKAGAAGVRHYESPIAREIVRLRQAILSKAEEGQWALDPALLDDRHLVRRMILKRVVHGADKNLMAVELAKLALWLHTFTVGAPLSFLDHHLRCGDSLYGEKLVTVRASLQQLGDLFSDDDVAGLMLAAQTLSQINSISDVDLREVERSRALMAQAHEALSGLKRVFDVWQALRWIAPLDAPRANRTDKHRAAAELLSGRYRLTLMEILGGEGFVHSDDPQVDSEVNSLLDECRALAKNEGFLHWELAFPSIWPTPAGTQAVGGFDALIGNPPWDRMKLQEVEWFADRRPEIAMQSNASNRKRMVAELRRSGDPLARDFEMAAGRAEASVRVARTCGEYPLLSGGDTNLYSLFVERSASLVSPRGVVGLLTPSGIAADKGAADFFKSISTTGRLGAFFDFENKKVFFPDVHSAFKFAAMIFGGEQRTFSITKCAFYLHSVDEIEESDTKIELAASDFATVNPNTGTAPIFRSKRDAELTSRIYRTNPILSLHRFEEVRNARRGTTRLVRIADQRAVDVNYMTMFHMTNDAGLFRDEAWLNASGAYRVGPHRWRMADDSFLPLYEGKMVQAYDHRAAGVVMNLANLHRPAQPESSTREQKEDPSWLPSPQYWVAESLVSQRQGGSWHIGFKDVTAPTNMRTMIAAVVPHAAYGNTLPLLTPAASTSSRAMAFLLANLNSFAFDFCARQKVQGQHLNWYVVEQLPVIAQDRYEEALGAGSVGDLVVREVLRLSYTSHDLSVFARDLGYGDPPFTWSDEDRLHRQCRLDALFFQLYGLSRDEVTYVMSTFTVVQGDDLARFNRFRTRDLILGYMNALASGDIDSVVHA